ncbi:hypothetical protein KR026_012472, partial [Drosophila bipectinata]
WFVAGGYVLFWVMLFLGVVIPVFYRLPEGKTLEDAGQSGVFIAERAQKNLYDFDAIGVKLLSSDNNENKTHDFVLNELNKILANVDDKLVTMEISSQVGNGTFIRNTQLYLYNNVQNIAVKVTPVGNTNDKWVLYNTHSDSKPTSPSAGDAGFMVVIGLEILRLITTQDFGLTTTIIFLFNGAEENTLLGSHCFISQHEWADNCAVLVNMDAAGSGSKEILFQSGPKDPKLAQLYKKFVPHPFATALAEEIYQTGLVPSDTDFSIFTASFRLSLMFLLFLTGYDIGQCVNGYIYHTKYDRYDIIPRGSIQSTGENALALVVGLATQDWTESSETGTAVFFDFLGLFMISYSNTVAVKLNYAVAAVTIVLVYLSLLRIASVAKTTSEHVITWFVLILVVQVVAFVLGVGLPIIVAYVFDKYGLTLTYYSTPILSLGLYVCPCLVGLALPSVIYLKLQKNENLTYVQQLQMALHGHAVVLSILSIALNYYGLRTTYVFTWTLIFYDVPLVLNLISTLHDRGWSWTFVLKVFQVIPFMYNSYLFYILIVILTPMMGRFGQNTNPDLIISALAALGTVLSMGFLIVLINMSRRSGIILVALVAISAATIYVASSTEIGFPYRPKTNVQRLYYLQVHRVFYEFDGTVSKNESGYLMSFQDRRGSSPLIKAGVVLSKLTSLTSDCSNYPICGMPICDWRYWKFYQNLTWIPRDNPIETISTPPLVLLNRTIVDDDKTLRLVFRIFVTDHSTLVIQPLTDVTITSWSLLDSFRDVTPPYIVFYSYGLKVEYIDITIELTKPDFDYAMPSVIVGVARQFMNSAGDAEAQAFLKSLPSFTAPVQWPADYHQYIF